MPQAATIKSLPRAFRIMKAMQAQGIEWGEDYRPAVAEALKEILEVRMAAGIDRHLEQTDRVWHRLLHHVPLDYGMAAAMPNPKIQPSSSCGQIIGRPASTITMAKWHTAASRRAPTIPNAVGMLRSLVSRSKPKSWQA